jgi:hypothetical protein
VEYKIPGEGRFRMTTRPMHKLIRQSLSKSKTWKRRRKVRKQN